mgnify:CR=1 FL=1
MPDGQLPITNYSLKLLTTQYAIRNTQALGLLPTSYITVGVGSPHTIEAEVVEEAHVNPATGEAREVGEAIAEVARLEGRRAGIEGCLILEVRRAAGLIAAAHWLKAHTGCDLIASELGASAGLNLVFDRLHLALGGMAMGRRTAQ